MKKNIIIFIMLIMVISYITGFSLMNVMAESNNKDHTNAYYTSIQIKSGDSLWSIASEYYRDSNMSINEYINELRNINQLKTETIHSGQFLTIVYYQ